MRRPKTLHLLRLYAHRVCVGGGVHACVNSANLGTSSRSWLEMGIQEMAESMFTDGVLMCVKSSSPADSCFWDVMWIFLNNSDHIASVPGSVSKFSIISKRLELYPTKADTTWGNYP